MLRACTRWTALLAIALAAGCAGTQAPPPATGPSHTVVAVSAESDPAIAATLEPYRAELRKLDEPVATSSKRMPNGKHEDDLPSLVADVMREEVGRATGQPIDGLFINCGGIRAALPEGPISYSAISKVLPFDNTIVVFTISGAQAIELSKKLASSQGTLPVSGMEIDAAADGALAEVRIGGKAPDPAATYRIGTNSYLATGAGGFDILKTFTQSEDTKILMRDAFFEYAKRRAAEGKSIDPPAEPFRYRIGGKTVKEIE